jgi:hypothetical protein
LVIANSDSELSRTGVAHHDRVEPTGAAAAPGVRAELAAGRDEVIADVIEQFGGERARTDTGHVGLGDADDPRDVSGADTGAGARAAGNRIRRGHERIRAVIEIEERRLRAFEEHVLSRVEGLVDKPDRVRDVRLEPRPADLEILAADHVDVDGELVVDLGQHGIDGVQHDLELLPEDLGVEQVLHAQPYPHRLVGVRGPMPRRVVPSELRPR